MQTHATRRDKLKAGRANNQLLFGVIHVCRPTLQLNKLNPMQMLDRFVRIGECNSIYSLSTYFSDFFEALQSAHRNKSTRIEMFLAGLDFSDLKSLKLKQIK